MGACEPVAVYVCDVCAHPSGVTRWVVGTWRVTAQPLPARILGWACLEGMDASGSSPTNLILEQRHWDNRTGSLRLWTPL